MSEPTIAQKEPFAVEVETGKKYFWCACGKSAKQPFCDGSHRTTSFEPIIKGQKNSHTDTSKLNGVFWRTQSFCCR